MDLLSRLTDPIVAKAARARGRPLLDAAMAAAALAAYVDGPVSFAQRVALDQVLDEVDALKAFGAHAAVELFQRYVHDIQAHPEHGRARAMMALAAVAGNPVHAELLVRIAQALAGADGAVSTPARAEVAQIAAALGVAPPAPDTPDTDIAERAEKTRTVIVLGNEKGGTGKSTTAMHLCVALLDAGHAVGSIDLDGRQGTFSRYIENRRAFAKRAERPLALPTHRSVSGSDAHDRAEARAEEKAALARALDELGDRRFIVIDTPGSRTHLSRLGHARADILLTPLNDSFVDLDVLARIDMERREVIEPSAYARMVRDQAAARAAEGRPALDWIVMRNRLAHIDARNTREMAALLDKLAPRMGFRLGHGLSERVVFRELFYRGLTILDLPDPDATGADGNGRALASHRRARAEVRDLLAAIRAEAAAPRAAGAVAP